MNTQAPAQTYVRLTPEQLDKLLTEYGTAMQMSALASVSPALDAGERMEKWNEVAVQKVREIREGVFP